MPSAVEHSGLPQPSWGSGGGEASEMSRINIFRPRRTHKKSRNGCSHCRRRRIKCNELRPRCTRCERGNLPCRYPIHSSPTPSPRSSSPGRYMGMYAPPEGQSADRSENEYCCRTGDRDVVVDTMARGFDRLLHMVFGSVSPTSSSGHSPEPFSLNSPTELLSSTMVQLPAGLLDANDSALFHHYLNHTSQAMSFDERDAYSVRVGIPDMALRSPTVMGSLLALAATCCCCDVMAHPAPIPGDRERVMEFLATADRHHLSSLRGAIQTSDSLSTDCDDGDKDAHYAQVLANALLMAYYGSGSQRVRVWLAETMSSSPGLGPSQPIANEFLPNQTSWLSLFHAMNAAFVSIVGVRDGREWAAGVSAPYSGAESSCQYEETILPFGRPKSIKSHVLYPMISSTCTSALQTLWRLVESMPMTATPTYQGGENSPEEMKGLCLIAVQVLGDIIAEHCLSQSQGRGQNLSLNQKPGEAGAATRAPQQLTLQPSPTIPGYPTFINTPTSASTSVSASASPHPPLPHPPQAAASQSQKNPAWLRDYLTRLLAVTPSRPFRRVVMTFLFRVPLAYLTVIQRILDGIPADMVDNTSASSSSLFSEPAERKHHVVNVTPQEALAIDIFAHWLAFTMLLDGVWFFGRVGVWELGRIVGLVRNRRLVFPHREDDMGEGWWPASIYRVGVAVGKHAK